MTSRHSLKTLLLLLAALACSLTSLFGLAASRLSADDQLRLRDICRLKGQEENTLQGVGLVVGLRGTGDDKVDPTTRALANLMMSLGANIQRDSQGLPVLTEMKDMRNIAAVLVTAKVPAAGAQQGDQLNCTVSATSAKSLQGGRLVLAHLYGPRSDDQRVYALAQGKISLPDASQTTEGTIFNGCKMETTITNGFSNDGKITLILDRDIASFSTAVEIQDAINQLNQTGLSAGQGASDTLVIAKAIDQLHIEVGIPSAYQQQDVQFVSLLLDIPLAQIKKPKRVVINEREGVIVIGEDVLISPVAISHKNLTIDARPVAGGFAAIDTDSPKQPRAKLKNLVDALNGLNVPTSDVIAIIRTLDRNGDLYGEVIFD
ncbi:MAG: flagellar basal body P-ring protein FlgI [Pirellulaceae bacterium]|nr:flagellar basal body P-ring protein FlgI [Pirellulaceae bacterium]